MFLRVGLHAAGSVGFMKPHGCFDPEELSSRSEKFIPVGWSFFSQWGGLVHLTGKHLLVAMFRISNPWSCAGEPTWVMEEVFVAKSRGQL